MVLRAGFSWRQAILNPRPWLSPPAREATILDRARRPEHILYIICTIVKLFLSKRYASLKEEHGAHAMRKRYNTTTHTKLEFIPRREGILVRPAMEEKDLSDVAGSALKHWTVHEMLKRLGKLRR